MKALSTSEPEYINTVLALYYLFYLNLFMVNILYRDSTILSVQGR